MRHLAELLGTEHSLEEISLALTHHVEENHAPVVGGMHVTCSDESERECSEAFQRSFVDLLLPELKPWRRAPFCCANLGGRYERGALRIAEEHFALPASRNTHKTMVVKVNSHVAIRQDGSLPQFGRMNRYNTDSIACGALHALLDGGSQPFTHELQESFDSGGKDRLAMLRDADRVEPAQRSLFAAIVSARLQARNAVLDIQDYRPTTPTVYLVAACVTLNRAGADTELLCGFYTADHRGEEGTLVYQGLGDDPTRYRLRIVSSRLHIEDG